MGGGFSVDNATMGRFFSLHYLLPFLIVGAVILHIVALHAEGSNNPLGIKSYGDKIPFYPYFVVKDTFGLMAFFCFFGFLYFLPFYCILRSIPDKLGGVLAMFGAIIILIFQPFIHTTTVRSSFFRPIYRKFY